MFAQNTAVFEGSVLPKERRRSGSIGAFSFNPAYGQGAYVPMSSAGTGDKGPPDRLRTALHGDTFLGAIRFCKEIRVALQRLRHHGMILPPGFRDETYGALIESLRGRVPPFPGEFLSPNQETASGSCCFLLTGTCHHINQGFSMSFV